MANRGSTGVEHCFSVWMLLLLAGRVIVIKELKEMEVMRFVFLLSARAETR